MEDYLIMAAVFTAGILTGMVIMLAVFNRQKTVFIHHMRKVNNVVGAIVEGAVNYREVSK